MPKPFPVATAAVVAAKRPLAMPRDSPLLVVFNVTWPAACTKILPSIYQSRLVDTLASFALLRQRVYRKETRGNNESMHSQVSSPLFYLDKRARFIWLQLFCWLISLMRKTKNNTLRKNLVDRAVCQLSSEISRKLAKRLCIGADEQIVKIFRRFFVSSVISDCDFISILCSIRFTFWQFSMGIRR